MTPETGKVTNKNSKLGEASRVSRLSRVKTGNTEHNEGIREHLEERAAIMEYEGGLTRDQAETEARRNIRVYEYRLTDTPDTWLVWIAPGCELEEARASLSKRFGSRLLDVRKHNHA